jgi:SnoaL-like polyketide cyclase
MPGWEMTVTTGTEALVRRATTWRSVMSWTFRGSSICVGPGEVRGEQLGDVVVWMGKLFPDVHRELHRVNVLGDVVSIELSIQGTFLGPFETPAGVIQPTGAKVDFPTADFWYLRNGKVEVFDCHIAFTTLFAQLGILPDYASAVAAAAPER